QVASPPTGIVDDLRHQDRLDAVVAVAADRNPQLHLRPQKSGENVRGGIAPAGMAQGAIDERANSRPQAPDLLRPDSRQDRGQRETGPDRPPLGPPGPLALPPTAPPLRSTPRAPIPPRPRPVLVSFELLPRPF